MPRTPFTDPPLAARLLLAALPMAALPMAALPLSAADSSQPPLEAIAAFSGHWRIDGAHSGNYADALGALVASQQQQAERRWRERRRPRVDPDLPPPLESENLPGESADRIRARYEEMLQPATELQVSASGNALELAGAGEPARRYAPDTDGQRMDAFGTALWRSRWQGPAFVIRARYTNGAVREQQFSVERGSGALVVSLRFNDPQGGKLQLTTRYLHVADAKSQGL